MSPLPHGRQTLLHHLVFSRLKKQKIYVCLLVNPLKIRVRVELYQLLIDRHLFNLAARTITSPFLVEDSSAKDYIKKFSRGLKREYNKTGIFAQCQVLFYPEEEATLFFKMPKEF